MSEIKINLENIFKSKIESANLNELNDIVGFIAFNTSEKYLDIVKESMLEFGKQLLELAAENAEVTVDEMWNFPFVDKQSIIDTINQVE